jgi:hypothetical protein
MKLKRLMFSTNQKSIHVSEITANYVLDPVEKTLILVDNSPIGQVDSVKRKTNRFLKPIKQLKSYLIYRSKNKKGNRKN